FSAFYPKEVTVEKWYTLLVYTYVPSLLDSVREDARKFKEEIGEIRESKPASTTQLTRGTEVTIVLTCEGVRFNPERVTFQWLEDQHRAQFRLRANATLADMAGNVLVTIYVGPLIVGTLKMGVLFSETEASPGSVRSEEVNGQLYHQDDIFISYSHRDTEIVRSCKKAYEALGHNVLIDFESLRSGQKWNAELMRMIERANIFQLFWSENSSKSDYCRQEWEYALKLNRGEGFIRPVFWNEPIPDPPTELSDIHFDFAPFAIQD
ncbi:MAG: toll/interleukin-1 receptor domain-containing protein, partial [Anaerolineales bacterium]